MMNKELDNKINHVLSGWDTPSIKSKNTIWKEVVSEVDANTIPLHAFSKWRWIAAASLFTIVASFGTYYTAQVEVLSNQQAVTLNLPDGSIVNLNVKSKASYNKIGWLFNRSVSLTGEGFFTVKKGEKFSVITENGHVDVLGTSFNVLARNQKFRVECFTGRVNIITSNSSTVITKGEVVTQSLSNTLIKEVKTQPDIQPNWLTGNYSYKNKNLSTVLNDVSDHFGIDISTSHKINNLSFTGAWNKTMTLDEVLKIVCLPFSLEAISTGNKSYNLVVIED